jgi:uncharacterized protein YgiM (DUF1202 family)
MKKSAMVFLMICSVVLMACQIQYLISGQPASATEIPAKSRSTATLPPGSIPPPGQTVPPGASAQTTVTANDDLVIRSTASTVAPSMGQMKKGDVAQVTARTATNDWFQVAVFSGLIMTQGWVQANQVTLDGPLDKIPVVQPGAPPPPPASSKAGLPTPTRQTYPSSSQPIVPTLPRKTYP